jgi:hypothetical protein
MQTSFIAAWQIEHVGFKIASEDGVTSGDRFNMTIASRCCSGGSSCLVSASPQHPDGHQDHSCDRGHEENRRPGS